MTGLLFEPTAAEERAGETDKTMREDLPTPPTLIAAIFADLVPELGINPGEHPGHWAAAIGPDTPYRVLDVCCGYGAFAMMFARHWVHVLGLPREWLHITGVEIKHAREQHMRKWCDFPIAGVDWRLVTPGPSVDAGASMLDMSEPFDLVVGNPHFTALTHDDPAQAMPAVSLLHAPNVALLHTNNAFQRGEPGRAVERACPPAVSWRVPGTVSFDGTSGVASDCYTVSLWRRGHEGPTSTQLLSTDPKAANLEAGILKSNGEPYACWRWTVPPGTEEPSVCPPCGGLGSVPERDNSDDHMDGMDDVDDDVCPGCNGTGLDPNGDLPSAPGWTP